MPAACLPLACRSATDASANLWSSDGTGSYSIAPVEEAGDRGSKITIHLKDSAAEFLDASRLKGIVNKYSNFVSFPISIDGEVVNTVQAIWTQVVRIQIR